MSTKEANISPLSFKGLGLLYLRPSSFFSYAMNNTNKWLLLLVIWVSGIAYAFNKLDEKMAKIDFGREDSFINGLSQTWLGTWSFVLFMGAINGVILWYLAGWWYQVRLEWSGASNVDPRKARLVYMYQDLVQSGPTILLVIMHTFLYSSYQESWAAEDYLTAAFIVFPFYSCFVSYKGAITTFELINTKARWLFLIIPIALYIVLLGLVGILYSFYA